MIVVRVIAKESKMLRWSALAVFACGCLLLGCTTQSNESGPKPDIDESSQPSLQYLPMQAPAGIAQAVIVQGHPLVHTRQLLPFDDAGNIVGADSADIQIEQVLANLQLVLAKSGSDLNKLVRLNVYANAPETADRVRELIRERLDASVRPAFTAVQTPLADANALVAIDAVAVADQQGETVTLQRCESIAGMPEYADAAIMPPGGIVYLSGQADKSPRLEATANSLNKLLDVVDQLKLDPSQIVQLKVFLDSATAADDVRREIGRLLPGPLTPPVVFVEWIASAPVEIEMIVHRGPLKGPMDSPIRYYTPPGVKASPTFSRVALVESDRQIYISGLSSRAEGNAENQTRDVFEQLQGILSETGSDLRHLAKATYYVSDQDASTMLNKIRPEFYDPQRPPAASKAMVHGVGTRDRTLMMDMIAVGVR